jgi:hypothetical protein
MTARAESELGVGVLAGANTATLDEANREGRLGFSAGLSGGVQQALGDRFALGEQLELLYTPRGAKVVDETGFRGESREHYIDATLTVHPGMRVHSFSAYLVLGASLDVLLSANKRTAIGSPQDITDDLHRIDVAVLGGLGVAWRLGSPAGSSFRPGAISLEVRHDIGLIDSDAVNGGFKNRTTSVMLGVSFLLGGRAAPPPPDKPESQVATP